MKHLRPYQNKAVSECLESLKKNDDPVLLMASVGSGKSLMLATILLTIQNHGKRALCLVNNAELVRNNNETFINQGGSSSIYCAALMSKDDSAPIIFGTPKSILNGINNNENIGKIRFDLIVVDEAHAINYSNHISCFMRILRHYKHILPSMRLLGATGTNFRFRGAAIVGPNCLFKTQVGNITTEQLIDDGYLIKPEFEIDKNLILDFSQVKVKKNGQFDQRQLQEVVEKSVRLTELICRQVVHVMRSQKRKGVFFFATTKKHALEILSHLPSSESAIILGDTPQHERSNILDQARKGNIKYLVNIAIVSVGVDIPSYDTVAYLRPTESLVLLVQTLGRVLRLSNDTNKTNALILDFAGNIDRHRDWDNPILQEAVKKTIDRDSPLVIVCPACLEKNTEHARRCTGKKQNMQDRCDYYFEFKKCNLEHNGSICNAQNDIASRLCHKCNGEIIDPNKKLSLSKIQKKLFEVNVIEARYGISDTQKGFRISCAYTCQDSSGKIRSIFESYCPISEKSLRFFYGNFVKKHCKEATKWYPHLNKKEKIEELLKNVETPISLFIYKEQEGHRIQKKIFQSINN